MSRRAFQLSVPWFALAIILGVGCAATNANRNLDTPEAAYESAVEQLADGDYLGAQSAFVQVRTRFPYSRYAALSDLRVGDALYEQGKFIEAVDAYRQFEKMHPTHEEMPYALLRIAEAYYAQAPEEWWFLPPTAEKDQASVQQALTAFGVVVERFPKSAQAEQARDMRIVCRRRLADHELYVARFYWQRSKWRAAASRAEDLARDYPEVGLSATALLLAAHAHRKAGDPLLARAAAENLVKNHAQAPELEAAQGLLAELEASSPRGSPSDG